MSILVVDPSLSTIKAIEYEAFRILVDHDRTRCWYKHSKNGDPIQHAQANLTPSSQTPNTNRNVNPVALVPLCAILGVIAANPTSRVKRISGTTFIWKSDIALKLKEFGLVPEIYDHAGVSNFKEYIRLALRRELVVAHGTEHIARVGPALPIPFNATRSPTTSFWPAAKARFSRRMAPI